MADRNAGLRREAQKSVTYGGPNNRFEIMTDAQGNRTVREVPEFAKAAQDERDAKARAEREAKAAPSWKEAQDLKARLVYQIGKLPADQRAAAYADLIANPQRYGISPEGMPSAWSDTYGTVAGNSGMTVAQASSNERGDRIADNRIATNDARTAQGAARVDLARAADARAERRSTLRKVPAAVTRKATIKTPTGFILD
ncbi:hypothetical protein [Sphingobium sp. SA916]|nr:hypothetical protein [Sphingobium sp. SA916]